MILSSQVLRSVYNMDDIIRQPAVLDKFLTCFKSILTFWEKFMNQSYYELHKESSPLGIQILYQTLPGGFYPLHWHDELEILYPLNGDMNLLVDGQKYRLPKKNLTIIESRQVHSNLIHGDTAMNVCIHVSKNKLKSYLPDIEDFLIQCMPENINDEQFPAYYEICQMLARLTKLYILDTPELSLETEGIVLQVMAHLLRHFAIRKDDGISNHSSTDRLHQILSWVEEHYKEPLSLADVADEMGVSREYFCRIFRKSMGISFQQYLAEIRLNHIYQDLVNTHDPVSEIMENNGFTNQKRFNANFKELYGCTPSEVRRTQGLS